MNRRQLLGVLAASTGVMGGCAVLGGEEEPRVTVETAIVTQPSGERHPTVEFTFANEGDEEITVSSESKKPFVLFPRLAGSTGGVVLIPGGWRISSDVADSRIDGCWRFVTDEGDDPKIETTDDIDRITLGPGQYHLVSHRVYYDGPDDHCFPDGDYTSTHVVEFHDIDATVEFEVRMAFSDGQISALDVEQRDGDD